jgi:DNA repair ATPase RecN
VSSELAQLPGRRVDELARMLAGSEITTKTRAHARELFEQHRRKGAR